MLMVISPAKTLDYQTPPTTERFTLPEHMDDAAELIERLRSLGPAEVAELMHLSDKLAALNVARYGSWSRECTPQNAKQALLAFKGDVYTGLGADDFSEAELDFAQRHLRMLSGLYGVLRPLDLMQPYRLEMGTRLANARGKDLYAFWGERISQWLNQALAEQGDDILLNLASNEYFSAVRLPAQGPGDQCAVPRPEERPVQDHQLPRQARPRPDGALRDPPAHRRPGAATRLRRAGLSLCRRAVVGQRTGVPARPSRRLTGHPPFAPPGGTCEHRPDRTCPPTRSPCSSPFCWV